MIRPLLAAVLVAAPLSGLFTAPAVAYCDPKYAPLCTNDCKMRPPNVKDPMEYLRRMCPE